MKHFILITIIAFTFSGCWLCEPDTQWRNKLVVLKPPEALLETNKMSPPPSVEEYMKADINEREYLLTLYILDLLEENGILTTKIHGLDKWVSEQEKIYKEENEKNVNKLNNDSSI